VDLRGVRALTKFCVGRSFAERRKRILEGEDAESRERLQQRHLLLKRRRSLVTNPLTLSRMAVSMGIASRRCCGLVVGLRTPGNSMEKTLLQSSSSWDELHTLWPQSECPQTIGPWYST
jgi:hypothetical protein